MEKGRATYLANTCHLNGFISYYIYTLNEPLFDDSSLLRRGAEARTL